MKKILITITLILCIFASCFAFCGCGLFSATINTSGIATGTLYGKGTQTITVELNDVTFRTTVGSSNCTLEAGFAGKKIDNLTFITEHKISITISGTLTITKETSYDYFIMNIDSGAFKGDSTAQISIKMIYSAPAMSSNGYSYMTTGKNIITASNTYVLPYGNFVGNYCNSQNITLADEANGTLSITLADNRLTLTVTNFDTSVEDYPTVIIGANCTTFENEMQVLVGKSYGEYPLL